jgi:hypothetical protein
MTRLQAVRAYWRILPDRIHTPPHEELKAAFMQDIRRDPKRLESELAKEIDRELENG